ncbi:mucin-7-like [Phacochoerus africanus]|uniref:mucin-7-like n=1 Tax=Phacochoerus africanus TaxID=41426 RepID=UPI001FDA059E|nr:mucin-7-like [Phacochoerus africanus]
MGRWGQDQSEGAVIPKSCSQEGGFQPSGLRASQTPWHLHAPATGELGASSPECLSRSRSSAAPHLSSAAPHLSSAAPHQSSAAPHLSSAAPHQSSTAPHQSSAAPHQSSAAPHQSSAAPHQSSAALRLSSAAPHQSSAAPYLSRPSSHASLHPSANRSTRPLNNARSPSRSKPRACDQRPSPRGRTESMQPSPLRQPTGCQPHSSLASGCSHTLGRGSTRTAASWIFTCY